MHLDLGPTTRASHRGASARDSVLLAHQMAAELNSAAFAGDVKVQQDPATILSITSLRLPSSATT